MSKENRKCLLGSRVNTRFVKIETIAYSKFQLLMRVTSRRVHTDETTVGTLKRSAHSRDATLSSDDFEILIFQRPATFVVAGHGAGLR